MALKKNISADLRIHYKRAVELSIIIALVLVIAAFRYIPDIHSSFKLIEDPGYTFTKVDVDRTKQDTPQPPPPPTPVIVAGDSKEIIEIILPDAGIDLKADVAPPPPKINDRNNIYEDPTFYKETVEEQPEIIGGLKELYKNIVYPELAVRADRQGVVLVRVFIDKTGRINKTELEKGIGLGCDEAAVNAINQLSFKPGKQGGVPVNVVIRIPIRFKIKY